MGELSSLLLLSISTTVLVLRADLVKAKGDGCVGFFSTETESLAKR